MRAKRAMDRQAACGARELLGGRARLLPAPVVAEARGDLLPLAFADLPFTPCRVFAVTDAPAGAVRGGHAHRTATQALVCLGGRIEVLLRAAGESERLVLAPGAGALVIDPGVWSSQTYLTAGAVLLALASEPYDPAAYEDEPAAAG